MWWILVRNAVNFAVNFCKKCGEMWWIIFFSAFIAFTAFLTLICHKSRRGEFFVRNAVKYLFSPHSPQSPQFLQKFNAFTAFLTKIYPKTSTRVAEATKTFLKQPIEALRHIQGPLKCNSWRSCNVTFTVIPYSQRTLLDGISFQREAISHPNVVLSKGTIVNHIIMCPIIEGVAKFFLISSVVLKNWQHKL